MASTENDVPRPLHSRFGFSPFEQAKGLAAIA